MNEPSAPTEPQPSERELLGRLAMLVGLAGDDGELLRGLLGLVLEVAGADGGCLLLRVGERYERVADQGWHEPDGLWPAAWLERTPPAAAAWADFESVDLSRVSVTDRPHRVGLLRVGVGGRVVAAIVSTATPREPDGTSRLAFLGRHMAGVLSRLGAARFSRLDNERLRLLLDTERTMFSHGLVVVFRWLNAPDWPVEYVSENVKDVLGYPAEDWRSGVVKYADIIVPDDIERVGREVVDATGAAVESFTHEDYRVRRADGRTVWLHDHTAILYGNDGVATQFLGYVFDVTRRREVEQQRLAVESKVQQAQRRESLSVLSGGIAHDFNNLLTGILGNADLAQLEVPDDSPARQSLHFIEVATRRAAELVHQLLAYSGKAQFVVETLSLTSVVEEMIHLLETAISKKAALHYDFSENAPLVRADATQIRQVVMNLITNASDAIGNVSGVIDLRTGTMHCDRQYLADTYLDDELGEGSYSYLEVADSGCGMDQEVLGKIFDPFFSTKFSGRGLGLAAVTGIVRRHGGALKVTSTPGDGTTFRVLFPLVEGHDERDPAPLSAPGVDLSGVTVMLVDDEPAVRTSAARMIERMGASVVVASDGRHAIELYRAEPERFAVIILDLTMPQMDGEECLTELQRIDAGARVIISSGYSEQDLASRPAVNRQAGFLQKPYSYRTLLSKLSAAVSR